MQKQKTFSLSFQGLEGQARILLIDKTFELLEKMGFLVTGTEKNYLLTGSDFLLIGFYYPDVSKLDTCYAPHGKIYSVMKELDEFLADAEKCINSCFFDIKGVKCKITKKEITFSLKELESKISKEARKIQNTL